MSRIEVPMPQMGESIAEGTVSKWLKQIGDQVERDEAILEISTDKVDAEIPAPAAGILVAIEVKEGETVEVGTVIAFIDTEGGAADVGTTQPGPGADEVEDVQWVAEVDRAGASSDADSASSEVAAPDDVGVGTQEAAPLTAAQPEGPADSTPAAAPAESGDGAEPASAEERLRTRSTPVVRRIASEHGIEIADVQGTGHAGRVTKQDILAHLESAAARKPAAAGPSEHPTSDEEAGAEAPPTPRAPKAAPGMAPAAAASGSDLWAAFYSQVQHPEVVIREGDDVEPMDKVRRLTAEHMVLAKRVAPHVHSFIEVDFTRVDQLRRMNKERWAEQGASVSFTAFVTWACARVLRDFPTVNGTVSGNNLVLRGDVNVGIAVDLDPGLIVPVIRNADDLSLVGIGKKILDLAGRARSRRLSPDEIQGATFSITNPGVLGTLVGMPIIPKGTAAILGTGAIEKRPVVVEDPLTGTDSIAIRKRALFSLGYDHRIVDGADAARFLSSLKALLEGFPDDA